MATPDRDIYTKDGTNRTVYTRENNSTAWFIGIVVVLALLAIAYLVFSANSQPSTTNATINNTPAVTTPATPADTTALPGASVAPMTPATSAPAATAPASDAATTAPSAAVTSAAPSAAPAPSAAQ